MTETREDLLTAMAQFFATPERHYNQCPECMSEEVEVITGVPSDGHNIELHVLKRCDECEWVRTAKFEADQSGRPPLPMPTETEADAEEPESGGDGGE